MRWLMLSFLLMAGCKQGVGDRCNVDADCDDGLICVRPPGGTAQSGGVCQMPGGVSTDLANPVNTD